MRKLQDVLRKHILREALDSVALALWVVVLSRLPKTPATRVLRMFGKPTMQLEVLRELNMLAPDDPENVPWVEILADVRYLIEHCRPEGARNVGERSRTQVRPEL